MKKLIKSEWWINRKKIDYKIGFFAIMLIAIGCLFFYKFSTIDDLEQEMDRQQTIVRSTLTQFQRISLSDTEQVTPLYENVVLQSRMIETARLGIIVESPDVYYKGILQLAQLRDKAYSMEDNDNVLEVLPSKRENDLTLKTLVALGDKSNSFAAFTKNAGHFVWWFLSFFSPLWFIIVVLISSDLLLNDRSHLTLINGYPFSKTKLLLAKVIFNVTYFWGLLLFLLGLLFMTSLAFGYRSFVDPVAITTGQGISTRPLWQVMLFIFSYLAVLTLVVVLLSVLLNLVTKNRYITILGSLSVGLVGYFLPQINYLLPYGPTNIIDPVSLLVGQVSETSRQPLYLPQGFLAVLCYGVLTIGLIALTYLIKSHTRHSRATRDTVGGNA